MAFPVVQTRATGRTTAVNTTSHAITLPTGITNGDLLVLIFSCDGIPDINTSGNKWVFYGYDNDAANAVTSCVFWKIADGTDSLTLTTSTSEQSSHICLRISGASGLVGDDATASGTNSNPPSQAMPYGAQDYLWIAARSGDSTVNATAAPTNYSTLTTINAAGTGGASTATAERSLNATTEDPGTFTSTTEQWIAWTIGIVPTIDVVQLRDVSTSNNNDTTSITATTPVNIDGDLLVAFACCDNDGDIANVTAPAGWTQTGASATTVGAPHARVYWRVASSEPASYTWGAQAVSQSQVVVMSFYGADTSSPFQVTPTWTSNATASTTHTAPSATLIGAGALLALYGSVQNGTYTTTAPSGMVQLYNGTELDWTVQLVAFEYRSASGATGTRAATYSPTMVSVAGSLALTQATGGTHAAAENAAGTGTSNQPKASVAPNAGHSSGTGTANTPTAKVSAKAENATGAGVANQPTTSTAALRQAPAGHASGLGYATFGDYPGDDELPTNFDDLTVSVAPTSGLASGTGTGNAPNAAVRVTAQSVAGTGAANSPSISTTTGTSTQAGQVTGVGDANQPATKVTCNAENTAGAGTANAPNANVAPAAGFTAGTGAANSPAPSVKTAPGNAAGSGTANAPTLTVTITTGVGTGIGTANQPAGVETHSASAGATAGTGSANDPALRVNPNAGATAGTGVSNTPTVKVTVAVGQVTGTGDGKMATVQTTAATHVNPEPAAGTGTANTPTASVAPNGGHTTGTGTAHQPYLGNTGHAAGTGAAFDAATAVSGAATAGHASASGAANQPTATLVSNIPAGSTTATAAANQPSISVRVAAGHASGEGDANNNPAIPHIRTSAENATGTGIAYEPESGFGTRPAAGLAAALGTAFTPVVAGTVPLVWPVHTRTPTRADAGIRAGTPTLA